jgi:hypothetical protein
MQTLYPQIKPHARHDLAVDKTHTLYVDESGSPEGLPVYSSTAAPAPGVMPRAVGISIRTCIAL